MLFSNEKIAAFIGGNFEPAWVMVREVPIVRIDFGKGNVVTRTLHGNILTSVCTADGQLLDALPGIYEPAAYLEQLDQLRLLARAFQRRPAGERDRWLRSYHEQAAAAIRANQPSARFVETRKIAPVGKRRIEAATEVILVQGRPAAKPGVPAMAGRVARPPVGKEAIERPTQRLLARVIPGSALPRAVPKAGDVAGLARWEALAADTKLNETTRRRQIHELLAKNGLVAPAAVLKPIYKDVLLADLDDPYLGLGPTLFGSYPFAKEDEQR